jgi:hypothetical protein
MIVGDRKQFTEPLPHPLNFLRYLAFRTVTIAARVVFFTLIVTLITITYPLMTAQFCSPAALDRFYDFLLEPRKLMARQIAIQIPVEYIC